MPEENGKQKDGAIKAPICVFYEIRQIKLRWEVKELPNDLKGLLRKMSGEFQYSRGKEGKGELKPLSVSILLAPADLSSYRVTERVELSTSKCSSSSRWRPARYLRS